MSYQCTKLENGLRIASEHLPSVESATICFSFNAGARQETDSQHGLAHLLEHMAFKGTQRRNARQIAEAFDDIGGSVNAYTSMEKTVYYARVLKEHLPVAVDVLADILRNSTFTDEELKREQEVIVQEIGMHHDSPEDLVFDNLHEVAYGKHALGKSILGTAETVRRFTADDLREFIASHYHAPTCVISAAGNLQHDALVSLMQEHFSDITQAQAQPLQKPKFQTGENNVVRDELEQMQVMMAFKGITPHDESYYATQLLSTLFGGGMSSRLFQEVREKRGLAYSVASFLTGYQDGGMFGIYAATGAEKKDELINVLKQETAKLLDGVSDEELTRAKNQQKAGLLMRRESVTAVAEWIGRHLQDYDEYRTGKDLTAYIDAVTKADVIKAAAHIFEKPEIALATLGPKAV
ncbi:MAG: pitrilysin family protein [Rickettsiales bacterium]|nr:pitrilysin family protein [Rickettsiales bacterium]